MSAFQDAVAEVLPNVLKTTNPKVGAAMQGDMATAVLAMPEMQAIRKALQEVDRYWWIEGNWDRGEWLRTSAELPESVIAWVLDGES